jgi:hypothetical protein
MTPNQEPVERELWYGKKLIEPPSIYEHGVLHLGKYGDGFIPERLATQKDINALSHQKALSRAEVLEEIAGEVASMSIDLINDKDEYIKQSMCVQFQRLIQRLKSDTLAVVDEMQKDTPEYKPVGYLKYNQSGEVKRKRVSLDELEGKK